MLKIDLRLSYTKSRNLLSSEELKKISLDIARKIVAIPIWSFSSYHIFLPITSKKEIDTQYIISILKTKQKRILIPKAEGKQLKHFVLTNTTELKKNTWNVPEPINGQEVSPKEIDVVFIPLLAFDEVGNRVGYGKGFYDTFLKQCNSETLKIGLSHFEACEKITDVYDGDIGLDYCITPNRIYQF